MQPIHAELTREEAVTGFHKALLNTMRARTCRYGP